MTALAHNRATPRLGTGPVAGSRPIPIAASTHIYAGGLVGINSSGYAVPGASTTALRIVGVADKEYDNSSGGAGALTVTAETGAFWLANSSAGDAISDDDVGLPCFAVDDQTVALTGGTVGARPVAGEVLDVDATYGVCVAIGVVRRQVITYSSTFDHADADINVAATSATRNITGTLPVGAYLEFEVDTTEDYSDGSTGTFALNLGDGTTATLYASDAGNVDGGASRVRYVGVGAMRVKTATALVATIAGSVNLSTATGGTFTVHTKVTLP